MDNKAIVNILSYKMLKVLGKTDHDLMYTGITVSSFAADITSAIGVLLVELTIVKRSDYQCSLL